MAYGTLFQVFPSNSLLGGLSRSALASLDRNWSVADFDKGQTIMSEDDTNSDVCFLLAGSARVAIFTEGGREVSVLRLRKGDCFGEFSAVDGAPRSASIEATASCVAARLTSEQFRKVLSETPDLSFAFLEVLVGKLRDLTHKISDFNALNADDRIRAELLELFRSISEGRDEFTVECPPTQTEIAARVFSNRETVAREMGRMRHLGLIDRDGRNLFVPSLKAVVNYVDQKGEVSSQKACA